MTTTTLRLLQVSIGVLVVVLDRVSKVMIERYFAGLASAHSFRLPSVEVIGDALRFTYVRNTGVVFGLFANSTFRYRDEVLLALSTIAIVILVVYLLRVPADRYALSIGLALVLGGAVGNLFDRYYYGYVVDFIDVSLYFTRWHVFNIADSAIVAGVGLMAIDLLRRPADAPQEQSVP